METVFSTQGYQRVIGGHYVVSRDRHVGLQVSCNSIRTIYLWLQSFIDFTN